MESNQLSEFLFGIYRGEVKVYQNKNKGIFDQVFTDGSYALLPMVTMPFPIDGTDLLQLISEISGNPNNHIRTAVDQLPKFIIQDTLLKDIVTEFFNRSVKQSSWLVESYELQRWFAFFNFSVAFPDDQLILDYLHKLDCDSGEKLADCLFASQPEKYEKFTRNNIDAIISRLKVKTNSISIEAPDDKIQIQYILPDHLVEIANQESVSRINTVRAWLPIFNVYETSAIMLPFPNEFVIQATLINANKRIPSTNLPSPFLINFNRIWNDELSNPFRSVSMYEWQEKYHSLRQAAVSCARSGCNVLELIIKGRIGSGSFDKAVNDWDILSNVFIKQNKTLPQFPADIDNDEFKKALLNPLLKAINDWGSNYLNYINQYAGLLSIDKSETRRLALSNIKSSVFKLLPMQLAFDGILNETYTYFDLKTLKKQETLWYGRLLRTSMYYGDNVSDASFKRFDDVQVQVAAYWREKNEARYQVLLVCLNAFSEITGLQVHQPSEIIEEEFVSRAVFGVVVSEMTDIEQSFELICMGMAMFSVSDLDFVTVVMCKSKSAICGWRFRKDYFDKKRSILEGKDLILAEEDGPMGIQISVEELVTLKDIEYSESSSLPLIRSILEFYQTIWLWKVYNLNANHKSDIDKTWNTEQIGIHSSKLSEILNSFSKTENLDIAKQMESDYQHITDDPDLWTDQLLANQILITLSKVSI
ncbi:MAG: hypothetical protein WC810_27785 [Janthinobacterium sp.]|jgi:hypothetical protein